MANYKRKKPKKVDTLVHDESRRKNIPTAEYQSVMKEEEQHPVRVAYERRNRDLDPQLVWRGKDEQNWSDLVVQAPPLYIQEKVHPKVLIDDLQKRTEARKKADQQKQSGFQPDLFSDFNGLPDDSAKTEFYQHDANWSNRMILGDSLQVMASLAEREGLRGKVQCIYIDPPYGIKFDSNFQWSTTSRIVSDGNIEHITREPEQVKAFRDTWQEGIHSYLTYLRDRLTVARDLLTEAGSIFVQIGDENVHRVRSLMDEIFGEDNYIIEFFVQKKGSQKSSLIDPINDYILWYSKSSRANGRIKFHNLFQSRPLSEDEREGFKFFDTNTGNYISFQNYTKLDRSKKCNVNILRPDPLTSGGFRKNQSIKYNFQGYGFAPKKGNCWKATAQTEDESPCGMDRLKASDRLVIGKTTYYYKRFFSDFGYKPISNLWTGFGGASNPIYVVQTTESIIERCILMSTDPGDLVLDPTCGSGTTAYVAEQWGRRWITIDTSRVALALARARIMGARYPYYILADSKEGRLKEAELSRTTPSEAPTYGNIRHGFVYECVPHITLKSIANNSEIDVIWEKWQPQVQKALDQLNQALKGHQTPFKVASGGRERKEIDFTAPDDATITLPSGETAAVNALLDWEVPRDFPKTWPQAARQPFEAFWSARIKRQKEIDASIAAKADYEYLYDKPYEDKSFVRVAGPFTVESISPHRVLSVDENDEFIESGSDDKSTYDEEKDFVRMILENLKRAGVQQAHKEDKIEFSSLRPWPGHYICAEGRYSEGKADSDAEKRAAVFIGPEFGTVSRPDLVAAAREAGDAGFDALITCAFNYDAHSSEFEKLGRIPILKARMNADLHMGEDLANTGKGNLFVIFGEPDIDILNAKDDKIRVKINGVDVFHPSTGEIRSDGAEGIACWLVDTDYNEESFFVRHAYFLGANDPYKSLKTSLKAEINQEAWDTLNSDTSRPFDKPKSGRIAVKVINHLGDEVMKVFKV
ncbi:site-specific DNA-methyltransferase [candidate division KSB1 bacterium]|nr:site-specific DNA-methyltransferase [candidate division KSB1 bacterium]